MFDFSLGGIVVGPASQPRLSAEYLPPACGRCRTRPKRVYKLLDIRVCIVLASWAVLNATLSRFMVQAGVLLDAAHQ